jgi:hypothetical protein
VALTEAQKADCRLYLGYARGRDLNPALEYRLDAGVLTAEEEARVGSTLVLLAALDAKLQGAALNNLDLERAEDVTFLGPAQLVALRAQGRMLVGRLAILLEVEVARDFFDAGGGTGGSMGGFIPLG